MFRDIRRSRQTLAAEEGKDMLARNTAGVLSLHDAEYPYGVPLSYAYDAGQGASTSAPDLEPSSGSDHDFNRNAKSVSAAAFAASASNAGLGVVYFHCATQGHKLDAIAANEHVSFCVIDQDAIMPEVFTTAFRSVIVFGRARLVEDDAEKRHGLELLARKYSPGFDSEAAAEIEGQWKRTSVVAIDIDHLSAKEAIELIRERG